MTLSGLNAIVTGASQGLGKEIAKRFISAGASVIICARNGETLESAAADLRRGVRDVQKVVPILCDVSDPGAVDQMVEKAMEILGSVDILVNNAGVHGPFGLIEDIDWEQWVEAVRINLLGTVYTSRAVLPGMRARGYGKIINLSGGGATSPFPRISAYAASKAAVVRFTETLALEVQKSGIDVNAVAPGALNTRLMDQLLAAGPKAVGEAFFQRMQDISASSSVPLEKGAALCVYLASRESDGITGRLLSAVWDPWHDLKNHESDIAESDIYTLRRIIPKDRGMDWGDV